MRLRENPEKLRDSKGAALFTGQKQSGGLFLVPRAFGGDALGPAGRIPGKLPVNTDGGLKAMGHPVGASGIRMVYESWLQFHGKAGERQIADPKLGLAHNLGGYPWENVSAIAIVGKELG